MWKVEVSAVKGNLLKEHLSKAPKVMVKVKWTQILLQDLKGSTHMH